MNVLVVGSAKCVWEDLRSLGGMEINAVVAVNRMTRDYPLKPSYGVSYHFEHVESRFSREGVPFVSIQQAPGVDIVYNQEPYCRGTSGLYGVGFAMLIGAQRVVLAGIPIDETPHYYKTSDPHPEIAVHRTPWQQCLPKMRGRVFSLSGWTRDLLGPPP